MEPEKLLNQENQPSDPSIDEAFDKLMAALNGGDIVADLEQKVDDKENCNPSPTPPEVVEETSEETPN